MRFVLVLGLTIGLIGTGGCSTSDDSSAAITPDATASSEAASLTDDNLLVAQEMPIWNAAGTWVAVDDADVLRACSLPAPDSLGALAVLTSTFEYVIDAEEGTTPDPDSEPMLGVNQVSVWPDEAAAQASVQAWTSALTDCSAASIGTVDGGSTWTLFTRDESSDGGWFDFVAVAAKGSATTLVGFSLYGQDANYEGDPLADSLEASLARLP